MPDPFLNFDYENMDKEKMIDQIINFSNDCQKAWQESDSIEIPESYKTVNRVVLLGMGGSGAANEAAKEILLKYGMPIESIHDYDLLGYVDENTLVIASSYSGNTEEPLQAFAAARNKGSKLFAITTGGKLKELVGEYDCPSFLINFKAQPRMAFAYLFMPLLRIFMKLDIFSPDFDKNDNWNELEKLTKSLSPEFSTEENIAKSIALSIQNKLPVIYSSPLLKSCGLRLKNQFNENYKSFAIHEYLPELNHNSIEGYGQRTIPVSVILMNSAFDSDRIKLRQNVTLNILKNTGMETHEIVLKNMNDQIMEHLGFVAVGDAISYYAAIIDGIDPSDVPNIRYLKSLL
jgi:glucose/mannose-6-phosphate isomerase